MCDEGFSLERCALPAGVWQFFFLKKKALVGMRDEKKKLFQSFMLSSPSPLLTVPLSEAVCGKKLWKTLRRMRVLNMWGRTKER